MKIRSIYLGTWIPRTTLHLREVHHFLNGRFADLKFSEVKLRHLLDGLHPKQVKFFEQNDFAIVEATFENNITFKMFEDGVIFLRIPVTDVVKAQNILQTFYDSKLGPSLSFLFSSGAPLPKSLNFSEDLYPLLFVAPQATPGEIKGLFMRVQDSVESHVASKSVDVYFGAHTDMLVTHTHLSDVVTDELLSHIVFLREFEKQLYGYIHTHRKIWDDISLIRDSKKIRFSEFSTVRNRILDSLNTLSYGRARIIQMGDIVEARVQLTGGKIRKTLETLGLDRYSNILTDQKYVLELWEMTIEHVKDTLNLLESLYQENTQRELNTLKFITLIAAITSFFGMNIAFPWDERWTQISTSSYVVVLLIIVVCVAFYFLLKQLIYNRYFTIQKKHKRHLLK